MVYGSAERPRILIVDDKMENQAALQVVLEDLSVDFERALSGEEAIGFASRYDYAIALIDVDLPGMDGFDVVEFLNRRERASLLPMILFCQEYVEEDRIVKGLEAGAVDFMTKPITPEILKDKVQFFLELYAERQAGEKHMRELTKTVAELKEDQAKLRLLSSALEDLADAVMITDKDGGICWVNPAFSRLTGYSADEVIGRNPRILKSGKHDAEFYRNLWGTIFSGEVWRSEMIDKRKDGGLFIMETAISPVTRADGLIEHFVAIKHDITERKKAEQAREEAIKAKSQFISMASHEVRTPLTAMKEAIRLVLVESTGPLNDDQRELLDIARRNVDRLARLINDLLDFQKLGSGKAEFHMEENDINTVVLEIAQTMMPLAKEKHLTLATQLDNNVPKLVFDKDRITQVLTNVVNNAVKFTSEGGITINTMRKDNFVQVSVKDTGAGIAPQDLPKLFHEFEQLHGGGERTPGGSGLGLAISRRIMKRHNARIWAESESGKGTTVHFVLPVVERRKKLREE